MVDRDEAARLLLLDGQGLLDDPDRPATPKRLLRGIEALGFVQVDSIVTVARGIASICAALVKLAASATATKALSIWNRSISDCSSP